jgi:polysaccharide biosynthesis/export protein
VVFVYGEVQRPGRYRLDRGMTVMQAIAVSGGLTSRGTEKGLAISRRAETGSVEKQRAGLDDVVEPNDVVFVGESLF